MAVSQGPAGNSDSKSGVLIHKIAVPLGTRDLYMW